jgi:hypothetical protein
MKNYILLILALFPFGCIQSQDLDFAYYADSASVQDMYVNTVNNEIVSIFSFRGTIDANPTGGGFFMTSAQFGSIMIRKSDLSGNFIWAKKIQLNDVSTYMRVVSDAVGNVYIAGYFRETVDFDPGPAVFNQSPSSIQTPFLLKLDNNGDFQWVKVLHGSHSSYSTIFDIALDNNNDLVILGDNHQGYFYLNQSINSDSVGVQPFVAKFDSAGNYIWGFALDNNIVSARSVVTDSLNNIMILGVFENSVDFDPGANIFSVSCNIANTQAFFVCKLSSNGNFIWVKTIQPQVNSNSIFGEADLIIKNSNLYLSGYFTGSVDFDPGLGVNIIDSESDDWASYFLARWDLSGNQIWTKKIGGGVSALGNTINTDSNGNVYSLSLNRSTADADPGFGYAAAGNGTIPNVTLLAKYDQSGAFVWSANMENVSHMNGFSIDNLNNIYFACNTSGADLDMGNGTFWVPNYNAVVLKLNQNSCRDFAISIDSLLNYNCSIGSGYASVAVLNGTAPYTYVWNTIPSVGLNHISPIMRNTYTVTVSDAAGCVRTRDAEVNGPYYQQGMDLQGFAIVSPFVTGESAMVYLDIFNDGCNSGSGNFIFRYDPTILQFDSASIQPFSVSGTDIEWNFGNINYDSAHIKPIVYFTVLLTAQIGDSACFELLVNPLSGDIDTTNNIINYCYPIRNSYDPNCVQVSPQGFCGTNEILNEQKLIYTVFFQNMGNYFARNIDIFNHLDSNTFDISTFRLLGSSHHVNSITYNLESNDFEFRFYTINLPWQNYDNEGSQGFVSYQIHLKNNLISGTVIENHANIVFDYNPPIFTDTVYNTVVLNLPVCNNVAVNQLYYGELSFNVYPNPTNEYLKIEWDKYSANKVYIRLYNSIGQLIEQGTIQNGTGLKLPEAKGFYFLELNSNNHKKLIKVVKN